MAASISYLVGFVVLMVASILVVAQNDPCIAADKFITDSLEGCNKCVNITFNANSTLKNCVFNQENANPAQICTSNQVEDEHTTAQAFHATDCEGLKYPAAPPAQNPCTAVDITDTLEGCKTCVNITFTVTSNIINCVFKQLSANPSQICSNNAVVDEQTSARALNVTECEGLKYPVDPPPTTPPSPTPTPVPTTPTTNGSSTTTTTTTQAPTTPTTPNTTSTTTPVTPTNATTPAPTTLPTTTPATNASTTAEPSTTATPPTSGGMSVASFFGGIVFTLAISAIAYLVWRFYKVKMDRNYHTLSTNLI